MIEEIFVPTKRYVYFDDSGKITSVSNSDKIEGNRIEVELNDVINLISGKEQFHHYNVLFDKAKKTYILKHVFNEEDYNINVNDQIYRIPRTLDIDYDLKIIQDIKNKSWKFYLDETIKYNMIENRHHFFKVLPFSFTRFNDPHQLERYVTLNLQELASVEYLEIPFENEIELDSNAISIYTTKRLEIYYHEVIE